MQQEQKVVHEFGGNAMHRIVLFDKEGQMNPSKWFAYDSVAQHHGYYAATEYFTDTLPTGIFRCKGVAHQTVNV